MKFSFLFLIVCFLVLTGCEPSTPEPENEEELITDVTLSFSTTGGSTVTVSATDPDGEGPEAIQISGPINLVEGTEYDLSITIENSIAGVDLTDEITEENDEHIFFFQWTENLFSSPAGNGNVDNRSDEVNYTDFDANQDPLGLMTTWTTATASSGTFRIVLKHQPGIKSATSTAEDGETDIDLVWDINIQ